jgi:nucleotide-binding universal stress UspA family protein
MRTIVVGYDGEDAATRALERAIEDAHASRGRIVVVAVSEMPLNPEGPQNFGTLDDTPARMIPLVEPPELGPIFTKARALLEAARVKGDYVWAAGDAADAIIGTARERHADVVMLGAHHHGLLTRLFGTDVASEVERNVGCEVVVVD